MIRISVIVPIYNVEPYIRRCLESILAQTWQDFELLCVNDCTPDGSMAIVDEFTVRYPGKVRRIDNEKNLGLGASRDRGMAKAKGEYLVFFDSDDYVKADFLETYYQEMERSGADLVVGGYIRVTEGKEHMVPMQDCEMTPWLYPAVWMRMYRRSFLETHQLDFRGIRTYEDNPFNCRCMLNGAKVSVIPYCGYYYVCNPTSITRTKNGVQKYRSFSENYWDLFQEYQKSDVFREQWERMEYLFFSAILSCLLLQCHHAGKEAAYEMYEDYRREMNARFPRFWKNKLAGLFRPKGEQRKVRLAVSVYKAAEAVGLGRCLIWLLSH